MHSSLHRLLRLLLFAFLFLPFFTSAYDSSDVLMKTAWKLSKESKDSKPPPTTLADALAEITTLRQVLQHLLSHKQYKAPEPPPFLQKEREERAQIEKEEAELLKQMEQQWEVDPNTVSTTKLKNVPCTHHVSCDACLEHKCGWCIGARRCIEDIAWVCRGDHDHVGSVGKHDTCPTLESVEKARRERDALREAARIAYVSSSSTPSPDDQDAQKDGQKDAQKDSYKLPRGTYDQSCRDCVNTKGKELMQCLCIQPNGEEVPSEIDFSTCDFNTEEVINLNGQLACGKMSLTRVEAQKRAQQRLEQRELEELARVSNEMKGDDTNKKTKKSAKKSEEDQHRIEAVLKYVERSKSDATRGAKAPYLALNVDKTATQSEIRKAYRTLTLLLHPDKNELEYRDLAESAFREVVAAYEILSNPDKRAAFDDFGGNAEDAGGFETFWEYENSGKKDTRNFYTGHSLITQLTEQFWDRRLVGDSIWLVEFYAPW
jgi:hypothetical protein